MRWFLFLVGAIVIVFVQAAWLSGTRGVVGMVDITILFAVYLGSNSLEARTLGACWFLGLMRDVFSTTPFGFWAAVFLGAGALAAWVRRRFFVKKVTVRFVLAYVCALGAGVAGLAAGGGTGAATLEEWGPRVLWSSAATALFGLPFFWALRKARFAVGIVERT